MIARLLDDVVVAIDKKSTVSVDQRKGYRSPSLPFSLMIRQTV